jgi:hypothetical protein
VRRGDRAACKGDGPERFPLGAVQAPRRGEAIAIGDERLVSAENREYGAGQSIDIGRWGDWHPVVILDNRLSFVKPG